jgi:GT2 family glycosyltransferase
MVKLSIVIVNFNSGDYLKKCLDSIKNTPDEIEIELFVVDNASTDDSLENAKSIFKDANYIENKENIGFGKANNQALSKVKTEYILLLNPDTEIKDKVFETLISFMDENSSVGASTAKIILSNGKIDLTAHRGFPTPWASFLYVLGNDSLYHLTNRNLNEIHEVDAITGAFFLTRKSILEKVGLFDEDYFMYAEDIDLCYRIKKAGFKVMYIPTVSVLHHKGVSSGLKKHSQEITQANLETKKRSLDAFYQTMKIFYKKHYEKSYPFFITWLVYLGINLRWFLAKRKLTV